jgi:hypothetical protein
MTIYHINGFDIEHGGRGKWFARVEKDGVVIADRAPVVWERDTTDSTTVVWYPGTNAGSRNAHALATAERPLVAIAKGTELENGLMKFEGFLGLAAVSAKRKPWSRTPSPSKRLKEELSCTVDIVELLGWKED